MNKVVEKGRTSDRVAGGIGFMLAVLIGWALHEYGGTQMPDYVVSALGGALMYIITKTEEKLQ